METSRAEHHQKNQMEHLREAALADTAADLAVDRLVQISTILVQ